MTDYKIREWREEIKMTELYNTQKEMLIEEIEAFVKNWRGQFKKGEAYFTLVTPDEYYEFGIENDNAIQDIAKIIMDDYDMNKIEESDLRLFEVLDGEVSTEATDILKFEEVI